MRGRRTRLVTSKNSRPRRGESPPPSAKEWSPLSASTRESSPADQIRILLADDDAAQRKLATAALKNALAGLCDVRIEEVSSGAGALARLERGGINLVIVDFNMPGMDGLEVLAEIQSRQATVPIVMLTAETDRDVMLEAMRRGASDFLSKNELSGPRLAHVVRSSLELAQLRADVMRSHKLAAIGTLAGGIAHEFNNILQIILGHSQFALARDDPERWKKALKYCHDAADKGAHIVRQLLTFARRRSTGRTRLRLDQCLHEAVESDKEAALRDNVRVNVDIRATPVVLGEGKQLMQVILNLLTNARHACTAMVTSRAQLSPRIDVTLDVDGKTARLSVRDNGVGIPPEDVPRVFEPFFTTKGSLGGRVYDGKQSGTGLGLPISASIVQGYGGRIDLTSARGEGSTFTLLLPVAAAQRGKEGTGPKKPATPTSSIERALKGRHVLIVDDEEMIADLLSKSLGERGLSADVAMDAARAQELLRTHDYDLLLFDLSLAGSVGGLELLTRCRQMGGPNAAAPALAMTGHAPGAGDDRLFDAGFRGIVRKPFEMRELARLIADTLRAKHSL